MVNVNEVLGQGDFVNAAMVKEHGETVKLLGDAELYTFKRNSRVGGPVKNYAGRDSFFDVMQRRKFLSPFFKPFGDTPVFKADYINCRVKQH